MPLQAEPEITQQEHQAALEAIHRAVRGGYEPLLSTPNSYLQRELDTTSDYEQATNRAYLQWARSRTRDALMALYEDLKAAKVKVTGITVTPLMQSLELSKRAQRLEPITADDLMTPHALLKAINTPWHVSVWQSLTDKANRLVWGFYGGCIVLGLQLAFGPHGG
jgi:hypothetical protein